MLRIDEAHAVDPGRKPATPRPPHETRYVEQVLAHFVRPSVQALQKAEGLLP